MKEILIEFLILFLSGVALVFGADLVIKAVTSFAKKLGASEYFVGFMVVAIGTSAPELINALVASLSALRINDLFFKNSLGNIVLGNLIGANILDSLFVFGIMAFVAKKLFVEDEVINRSTFLMLILIVLPLILSLDGYLSKFDGLILIFAFLFYVKDLWDKEVSLGKLEKDVSLRKLVHEFLIFGIGIPILIISSKYFVISAVKIADFLNIPAFIIGLTIVSLGTTLPELSVGIISSYKGHKNIGFGNILGSVMFNILFILGVASLINPISVDINSFLVSFMFMICGVYIAILFLDKKTITWREGLGLLVLYITFLVVQLKGIFI
ncbi:MAG: sodium:calcium antiporter [Candidatus Woesearchaeota archaeon]